MSTLNITHLTHDIVAKKSYVSFVWSDDPNKRLGLEVPYGTGLDEIESAARTAVTSLAGELAAVQLRLP